MLHLRKLLKASNRARHSISIQRPARYCSSQPPIARSEIAVLQLGIDQRVQPLHDETNDRYGLGMTIVSDFEKNLTKRIKELDPLVAEHAQLTETASKLGINVNATGRRRTTTSAAGGATKTRTTRRGRAGKAKDKALRAITTKPGIGSGEVAKKIGANPSYVSKLVGELVQEGAVKREGRALHPTGG